MSVALGAILHTYHSANIQMEDGLLLQVRATFPSRCYIPEVNTEVCEGIMLTLTADSDWLVQELRAEGEGKRGMGRGEVRAFW